jgi:putative tryptophan/tyrosine transport system substrate-binding protein
MTRGMRMKRVRNFVLQISLILLAVFITKPLLAIEIGVAWEGKSGMANNVMKGFSEGLKGSGINVELQKDLASPDDLSKVMKRFEKEKSGMVVMRSTGAELLIKNPPKIPTFIAACNQPAKVGVIKNIKAPEGNITGVTYYVPGKTHIGLIKNILPGTKSVFMLMEKGHPAAPIEEEETKAACTANGIAYHGKMCSSVDEILSAVATNKDKVSAFIIGTQAMVFDNTPKIVDTAGKIPVFAYSEKPIRNGALAGYVADDETLGRMLAQSVIDVLVKGKTVRDVPVKFDPQPVFYLNGNTYKKLGLEISPQVLGAAKIIQ